MIHLFGASGAVGNELIKLLEREYDIGYLKLYGSYDREIEIENKKYKINQYEDKDLKDIVGIVLLATDSDVSKKIVDNLDMSKIGFVIDNSSAYRKDENKGLIVPEVNFKELFKNKIIANPNCCTILLTNAIYLIDKILDINEINITTYQSVSGAGKEAIEDYLNQINEHDDKLVGKANYFKSPIFNNLFSHNTKILDNGNNDEEEKIIFETQKILNKKIKINPTCVRVPVLRSHMLSVIFKVSKPTFEDEIRDILNRTENIILVDNREKNQFPEPINTSYQYKIQVGRIRKVHYDNSNTTFQMLICGDQLLKGAAYNVYQIYNKLI